MKLTVTLIIVNPPGAPRICGFESLGREVCYRCYNYVYVCWLYAMYVYRLLIQFRDCSEREQSILLLIC